MASRYDYPDPGTDPAYCDGLAPDEPYGPTCIFCGDPLPETETDYCSALCSAMADRDNREDR